MFIKKTFTLQLLNSIIMATNDQKPANEVSKSLKAHKEPDRLAAHPEQARLEAYKEETDEIVPAVSADVDETPKFIKYGAAVLRPCLWCRLLHMVWRRCSFRSTESARTSCGNRCSIQHFRQTYLLRHFLHRHRYSGSIRRKRIRCSH